MKMKFALAALLVASAMSLGLMANASSAGKDARNLLFKGHGLPLKGHGLPPERTANSQAGQGDAAAISSSVTSRRML